MSRMTVSSFVLAVVMAAGCQSTNNNGAVSDVPGPTPSKPTPSVTPPAKPAEGTPTITLGAPNRSAPLTPPPATGGNYTVRQGDTLWSIARNHYGDGQKWKTIVAANPGLTPEKMRIGQTIMLP